MAAKELLHLGNRAAVDQTLSRLVGPHGETNFWIIVADCRNEQIEPSDATELGDLPSRQVR